MTETARDLLGALAPGLEPRACLLGLDVSDGKSCQGWLEPDEEDVHLDEFQGIGATIPRVMATHENNQFFHTHPEAQRHAARWMRLDSIRRGALGHLSACDT